MPRKDSLVEKIQRSLKNKVPIDKYIKKLRSQGKIDMLFRVGSSEMTLLMYCAKENQFANVKELLTGQNAADPRINNKEGLNALAMAILAAVSKQSYDIRIIEELLRQHPIEQLAVTSSAGNLLYLTTLSNRLDLVQLLLSIGPVEHLLVSKLSKQTMPLHAAISQQNEAIVELLLKCVPEKQLLQFDKEGYIPLHIALMNQSTSLVKKLLHYMTKEQLMQLSLKKESTFDLVALSGNLVLIDWLISDYPELLDLRSKDEFTPLHFACKLGSLALVQLLLAKGPLKQVIARDGIQSIPLTQACISDSAELVNILLQYLPSEQLAAIDAVGNTILHHCGLLGAEKSLKIILQAAQQYKFDLKSLLLKENNYQVNPITFLVSLSRSPKKLRMIEILLEIDNKQQLFYRSSQTSWTALLFAIQEQDEDVIKILLEKGPVEQLEQKTAEGLFPLQLALLKNQRTIAKLLLSYQTESQMLVMNDSPVPPLQLMIGLSQHELFQLVVESKFWPVLMNAADSDKKNTPLHMAVFTQNYIALATLINKGVNVNAVNFQNWSPLHAACWKVTKDAIHLLIKAGATIEAMTDTGDKPLHIAAINGNLAAVETLLEYRANLNAQNHQGSTPLLFSIVYGHNTIAEYILTKGADPNITKVTNDVHVTPLALALQKLDLDMIKMLIKHGADPNRIMIKQQGEEITILQYTVLTYSQKPIIYETLKKIIPQLSALASPKAELQVPVVTANFTLDKSAVSGRRYLLSLGYSEELIEEFEQERKANKRDLQQNRYNLQFSSMEKTNKQVGPAIWLKGKMKSDNAAIFCISSSNAVRLYVYLDEASLKEQACDPSKLYKRRFKFDGYHFKKLDPKKGIYRERVKLAEDAEPREIVYTHELKINQLDRVLCFPLQSDDGKATVFIGLRYLPGGLHSSAQINALVTSIKTTGSYLEVKWPVAIPQEQDIPSVKLDYV